MPTNSKTTNTTKTSPTPFWKFVFSVATILAAVFILIGILVCLIGVSHTTIFLIATACILLLLLLCPTVFLVLAAGVIFIKQQQVHSLLCLIAVFFTIVLLELLLAHFVEEVDRSTTTNGKTTNTATTLLTFLGDFAFSADTVLLAVFTLIGTIVCLIGVYYTLIFIVANAWTLLYLFDCIAFSVLVLLASFITQPVYCLPCLIDVFFTIVLLELLLAHFLEEADKSTINHAH